MATLLKRHIIGLAAAVLMPAVAWAQPGGHSHATNGGQEQKIGSHEAEFVARGGQVQLYIRDAQDRPVDATQFRATAVILARGNEQRSVEMTPAGENRLAGPLNFPVDGRVRATVTLRATSGTEIGRARYNVDQLR